MNKSAMSIQIGVLLILLVCIADSLFLKDKEHNRQKRGFRMNAASRVAHGYGKRGYSNIFDNRLSALSSALSSSSPQQAASDELPTFLDGQDNKGSVLSTQDFSRLLQSSDDLANVIVRKFIDINDDDIISTDELFRRIRE